MTPHKVYRETCFKTRPVFWICLGLLITTIVVYWQVRNFDFICYDDKAYVTENSNVLAGLSLESIKWAFTATHAANWHPLTWLSHMLDVELYGIDPGAHHLTNLIFHVLNTLLVFLVFNRMTGAVWKSAFVGVLFALHPLHVESVVLIAQRKDVLSTFFWMLTLLCYGWYVKKPAIGRYVWLLISFVLGLSAKPMLVTLPFVLLLLDYWPYDRFRRKSSSDNTVLYHPHSVKFLLLEKLPLFLVTLAASVVTFLVQQKGAAVGSLGEFPLEIRLSNAFISYSKYIVKMFWPGHLAVHYPHPGTLSLWPAGMAFLLIVCVSTLVIKFAPRLPFLATGWLWYLGTLVPVIGLVQVGSQAMADRYTYVPLIGLYIMVAWGGAEILGRLRYKRMVSIIISMVIVIALAVTTSFQFRHWQNSIALFEHALDVTANNITAHNNLGVALYEQGRTSEAIGHYLEVLRLDPNHVEAHNNLGNAFASLGQDAAAIKHFDAALRLDPHYARAHNNLGTLMARQGRWPEAFRHFREALRLDPDYVDAHFNIGHALSIQGRRDNAVYHFSEAVRINPFYIKAYNNLGNTLLQMGRTGEAISYYRKALQINPNAVKVRDNLEKVLKE